jgi:hypothetical protein
MKKSCLFLHTLINLKPNNTQTVVNKYTTKIPLGNQGFALFEYLWQAYFYFVSITFTRHDA